MKTNKFKHVSDGQREGAPKSLNELMGVKTEQIGQQSSEEFEKALLKMPMTEMQTLAVEMGVRPLPDRQRLQKVLTTRHKKENKSYKGAYEVKHQPKEAPSEIAKEFLSQFK